MTTNDLHDTVLNSARNMSESIPGCELNIEKTENITEYIVKWETNEIKRSITITVIDEPERNAAESVYEPYLIIESSAWVGDNSRAEKIFNNSSIDYYNETIHSSTLETLIDDEIEIIDQVSEEEMFELRTKI